MAKLGLAVGMGLIAMGGWAAERGTLEAPLPAADLPGGSMELTPEEFGELIQFLKLPFVLPAEVKEKNPLPKDTVGATYAGVASCAECHEKRVATFVETAHAKTSALPTEETCKGSFEPGSNVLQTTTRGLHYVMQKREDGSLVQTALLELNGHVFGHQETIGLVTGSGKHGR